jgi:hypothetical protein
MLLLNGPFRENRAQGSIAAMMNHHGAPSRNAATHQTFWA